MSIVSVFAVKYGFELSPQEQADIVTGIAALAGVISIYARATPKK